MGKKAIDIVLLPEETMAEAVIAANAALVEQFGEEIVLNKNGSLPHISLAMGCIDEGDIAGAKGILEEIAGANRLGWLHSAGVAVSANAVGQKVSVLVVAKERQLQQFHEKVMAEFAAILSYDVTADMIYPSGRVAESTLLWIKSYREKSSFAKFLPHITLGYGQLRQWDFPEKFAAEKLALCHLGNHCMCRKILASVEL